MKPVVKWTVILRKTSTLWWSFAMAIFIFINMIFYPSFKNDAAEFQKSFENLPDAALQFLGGSADFFSPVGFMNSQVYFIMLPMILGILAISLGSGLLAREEQEKTIEGLLARPISRSRLLSAKAIAGSAILTSVALIGLLTILATSWAVDLEISSTSLVQATFVCLLMAVTFGAIAFALSATGKAKGASIGVATFVALGGYIIGSLAGTISWLLWPSKLFPFYYYQSETLLRGTYNWNNIWYFITILLLCAVVSWLSFRRRDLL